MPISDGGDGFVDCMAHHFKGDPDYELNTHNVLDPLLRPILGSYLLNRKAETAFLEVANTSGLYLLKKEERNPYVASSIVSLKISNLEF